LLLFYIISQRF